MSFRGIYDGVTLTSKQKFKVQMWVNLYTIMDANNASHTVSIRFACTMVRLGLI